MAFSDKKWTLTYQPMNNVIRIGITERTQNAKFYPTYDEKDFLDFPINLISLKFGSLVKYLEGAL